MMFEGLIGKAKKIIDETEQIDDRFYAEVIDELAQGFKDKAAVGKAIAQSDGDEAKFNSIYMKIRAKALQEQFMIRQEQLEIEEKHKLELNEQHNKLLERIAKAYKYKYFQDIFKDEIKAKGFRVTFFSKIEKDGIEYETGIDYENRDFLILDVNRKPLLRFHINWE